MIIFFLKIFFSYQLIMTLFFFPLLVCFVREKKKCFCLYFSFSHIFFLCNFSQTEEKLIIHHVNQDNNKKIQKKCVRFKCTCTSMEENMDKKIIACFPNVTSSFFFLFFILFIIFFLVSSLIIVKQHAKTHRTEHLLPFLYVL